jgi:hypothetical protein
LDNETKGVIGYPASVKWNLLNPLSNFAGERAYYKKDLIFHLEKMAETRFGVEVFLNHLFKEKEIKRVPLRNLKGLFKYQKRRPTNAIVEYHGEILEIVREVIKQKRGKRSHEVR